MIDLNDVKYKEYSERYSFWQKIAIEQLSRSNNLFISLSTGFLSFLVYFEKDKIVKLNNSIDKFNWEQLILLFAILLALLSIVFGLLTMRSRLWDFRYTRNIASTRKKYYKKIKNKEAKENKSKSDNAFLTEKKEVPPCLIFKVVFFPSSFLFKNEYVSINDKKDITKKMKSLLFIADFCGRLTWHFLFFQKLTFALSVISFLFLFIYGKILVTILIITSLVVYIICLKEKSINGEIKTIN